jgi:hypothetical protein
VQTPKFEAGAGQSDLAAAIAAEKAQEAQQKLQESQPPSLFSNFSNSLHKCGQLLILLVSPPLQDAAHVMNQITMEAIIGKKLLRQATPQASQLSRFEEFEEFEVPLAHEPS